MFSKSLFKQSCKANGMMWIIITVAVCFMLCCVMLIAGNGDLGGTKAVIEDAIIQGELESQTQGRAIGYYEKVNAGMEKFDKTFVATYTQSLQQAAAGGKDPTDPQVQGAAQVQAYTAAIGEYSAYAQQECEKAVRSALDAKEQELGRELTNEEKTAIVNDTTDEISALLFWTFNPTNTNDQWTTEKKAQAEAFYKSCEGADFTVPTYDALLANITAESHKTQREDYVFTNTTIFLAGNMVQQANIDKVLAALKDYGVTMDQYREYGYADYANVKGIARDVLVNYRAELEYKTMNIDASTEAGAVQIAAIKAELTKDLASGLLAQLPDDVSNALEEIGSADLYGTLVGSIFFKMAGLLLPIIYMIMTANALIAGQVDSGSMAYVLSSGTKRNEVVFTQAIYLIGSLFAMFLCTTITSMICFAIVDVNTGLTYGKLVLINLGAFLVMFAMSGICFLASCVFNRSKNSMALGGGLNMFFLVATMLGLFGSSVLPSIIRMTALNAFNYVSIISLFDVISILHGSLTFLWKWSILIVIGVICYVVGSLRFKKKDLPL